MNSMSLRETVEQWLAQQLAAARAASLSAKEAASVILQQLDDFGFDRGFLPDEVDVSEGLSSVTALIMCSDYVTEATIIAT